MAINIALLVSRLDFLPLALLRSIVSPIYLVISIQIADEKNI